MHKVVKKRTHWDKHELLLQNQPWVSCCLPCSENNCGYRRPTMQQAQTAVGVISSTVQTHLPTHPKKENIFAWSMHWATRMKFVLFVRRFPFEIRICWKMLRVSRSVPSDDASVTAENRVSDWLTAQTKIRLLKIALSCVIDAREIDILPHEIDASTKHHPWSRQTTRIEARSVSRRTTVARVSLRYRGVEAWSPMKHEYETRQGE